MVKITHKKRDGREYRSFKIVQFYFQICSFSYLFRRPITLPFQRVTGQVIKCLEHFQFSFDLDHRYTGRVRLSDM